MWLDDILNVVSTPFKWIDEGLTKIDNALGGVPGTILKGFETLSRFGTPRIKAIGRALTIGQNIVKTLGRYQAHQNGQSPESKAHILDTLIKPILPPVVDQLLNVRNHINTSNNQYMGKSNTKASQIMKARSIPPKRQIISREDVINPTAESTPVSTIPKPVIIRPRITI